VICPACHAENEDRLKFCTQCGTPLALSCPACGAQHASGQKFCGECGAALAAPASGPGAAPTPPVGPVPDQPAVVSAELRLVSVLFVDLVGFTSLSESREAEDVRELLGRYFDSARTIVERYGGTIEKFIGDAVMAVWGAPVAREDDGERAVRAALEIVDAVSVFGSEVGAPDLQARAGVVTGQVAAMENPGEGLVVGDRVNTASRVQSAARPGSVFVDEVTRQVSSAAIAFEDAGEHEVKGKAEPLRLWRAVRVVAGVGGHERAEGLEAPFVGRDADLRLLKELFHGAQERRAARLVAVSGEAGTGKSRLRREFTHYTDGLAETVLWHSGRCLSYGEGVAYWALAEMVRQRLGIPEDASTHEGAAKLATGLERWVPDPADREFLAPRLGALLGVVDPGLGREELFAGWRMFFERLAAHEPVVMVFEDLQWADEGLLDFLGQLLDWSAGSPIFILTLARPELADRHPEWPAARRGVTLLQLEPLDDTAMRDLLAGLVDELPRSAADQIVARAEGVPLYAVEMVRSLADRGVLVERDGRLVPEQEIGDLNVPASLGSLLAARLDALEPAERQLVKSMSVFGSSFARATAAALGEVEDGEVDGVLSALVRKQVLVIRADRLSPDRGQYAFAQGLLRTVAYEMLSRQERKARHLEAAEHLRQVFPGDGDEVAEVIANHLLDAYRAAQDDPDAGEIKTRAVAALRRAAGRAAAVGGPESAQRIYLTARELADEERERAELTQAAGEMALQSGRHDLAFGLFEEAAAAHEAAGRDREFARVAGRIGLVLARLGRNEEAALRITAALEILGAEQLDPEVGELNLRLASALVWTGAYETAAPALERALQIAADLQLVQLLAAALNTKSIPYLHLGRVYEARALLGAAIELARENDLFAELGRAENNSGSLSMQWDLPDGEQHLRAALALGQRRGDRYMESLTAGNLVTVFSSLGRWDEIEQLASELLSGNEDRPGREFIYQILAMLHARRGLADAARADLEQLEAWRESDDADLRATHAAVFVVTGIASGQLEDALRDGTAMLRATIETLGPACDPVRLAWPDTVHVALELGRLDDARRLLSLLSDRPTGQVPPYLRAELARGRAGLAIAESRHEDVEADLVTAIEALRGLGYLFYLARAQTDLAGWLIDQGRAGEADAHLEEAITTLRTLGAAPALSRAQALRSKPPLTVGAPPRV